MPIKRLEVEDFWTFLQRYLLARSKAKDKQAHGREVEVRNNLLTTLGEQIPKEWQDVDFLMSQVAKMSLSRDVHKKDVVLFRDSILLFLDFNRKKKLKEVAKMKEFQENLPIFKSKKEIIDIIKTYSVILIAGDTGKEYFVFFCFLANFFVYTLPGCGKSTQVPQYLLEAGYENICCTQPRRIACIALRNRLDHETMQQYGTDIGYQIRFEKLRSKCTKILFLTEGLLLRQMIDDPLLGNYNVIIIDEIHERHLFCDFLLGAIKCLLSKRRHDVKVILMSATVNCQLFSDYFGACPIIKVPGRLYPIQTEYFPLEKLKVSTKSNSTKINPEPYLKLLNYIDDKYPSTERGDVLVFLSGFMEIETVGEVLKNYATQNERWIILCLHSSLSVSEQDKVFNVAPEGVRKCILSTNIAETSLTIDGIRFVIDSGKVKEMTYDSRYRMSKLTEVWISKASAVQRAGRAGRSGPGFCFRLYTPKDFEALADFSQPEIRRVSLESLLLSMISMGSNDVRRFPFIEAPDIEHVENTLKYLIEHGALHENEAITVLGQILAKLPVDISIGKMLVFSFVYRLSDFILSTASCLSVQSLVSQRSMYNTAVAEERAPYCSNEGDLFTQVRLYSRWLEMKVANDNTRRWCHELGLEEQRFREVTKLRNQFRQILDDTKLYYDPNKRAAEEMVQTKAERLLKHGERKLYHQLKRTMEKERKDNKRQKVLKMKDGGLDDDDDQEAGAIESIEASFKDAEFKLSFDSKHLANINKQHRLDEEERELVKYIVAISFYPQLAIADQNNADVGDQLFHTADKPFVVLHPSSVYSQHDPGALRPSAKVEHTPLGTMSEGHYLLGYISFIETSKPYICNCYRVSAIHALLLAAPKIDTNETLTRLVFDQWLDIVSIKPMDDILIQSIRIRSIWNKLFNNLFSTLNEEYGDDNNNNKEEEKTKLATNIEETIGQLRRETLKFCRMKIKYSIRRLMAADLKNLYTKQVMSVEEEEAQSDNPLVRYCRRHRHEVSSDEDIDKGGRLYGHVTFNW